MCKKCFYLLFTLILFFYNCSDHDGDHQYFISKFYKHQTDFDKLMVELRNNELLQKRNSLKIFKPTDFGKATKSSLDKLGVREIIFYSHYCDSIGYTDVEFDLTTNWSREFPVHLNQTLCNSYETVKGNYFERDNTNEGWGLGDNWCLWFEHTSTKGIAVYYDKRLDTANSLK